MPTFDAPSPSPRRWPYIGRYGKPGIPRRDLPYTFLFVAILLGLIAVALAVIGKLSMAKESDLKFVAGSVQRAPRWVHTKGGPIIVIRVKTDDGLHDLVEQDLDHSQEIMNLRPGDQITARVQFWGGDHDIWELKRDGVTIQSYQDTYLYQAAMNEKGGTAALCFGLVASIFLTAALALRMYFGAWRDSTAWVPADAAGSVQGAIHYQPLSSADYPRTYYMSPSQEALTLLGGLILIGLGIFRLWSATADVSSMLPGILFLIFGIIAILRDLRFRVVLSADSIEVHNLVSTQVLQRDQILGRRLVQTRRAQIIRLMPQDGQQPVGVPLILKTDSAFSEWMDTIPDLDAQDPL
jgi:hypothetical protein